MMPRKSAARSPAGVSNGNAKATVADIGITRKEIHDARLVRDAEVADPGIVRRTVDEDVAAGKEPTQSQGEPRCEGGGQSRQGEAEKEGHFQEASHTCPQRDAARARSQRSAKPVGSIQRKRARGISEHAAGDGVSQAPRHGVGG
jgi:hypothetical protein